MKQSPKKTYPAHYPLHPSPYLPYLILLLASVLFFADSLLTDKAPAMRDTFSFIWAMPQYVQREFATDGLVPLWNFLRGTGKPFLADPLSGIFYPLFAFYYFFKPSIAIALYSIAHTFIAGAGIYTLLRHWQCTLTASLTAAIAFMFSTWSIAIIEFINPFAVYVWGPWMLLSTSYIITIAERSSSTPIQSFAWQASPWILALTLFTYLQYQAGYPEWILQTYILLGLFLIIRSVYARNLQAFIQSTLALVIAGVLTLLLSAPQFLLTLELISYSERVNKVNPGYDMGSLHPIHLLTLLFPFLFGRLGFPDKYWGITLFEFWVGTFYIGIPLIIALCTLPFTLRLIKNHSPKKGSTLPFPKTFLVLAFALIALFSLLMAAGKYTPIYPLFHEYFPLLAYFRWPSKFIYLFTYAIVILGGIALDSFLKANESPKNKKQLLPTFAASGIILIGTIILINAVSANPQILSSLTLGAFKYTPSNLEAVRSDFIQAALFIFLTLAIFLLIHRLPSYSILLRSSLVILSFANLYTISKQLHPMHPKAIYDQKPNILSTSPLREKQIERFFSPLNDSVQFLLYGDRNPENWLWAKEIGAGTTLHTIPNLRQDGMKLIRYQQYLYSPIFSETIPPQAKEKLLDLLSVRYIIDGGQHPFYEVLWGNAPKTAKVIERPTSLPRAFLVPRWRTVSNDDVALRIILSDSFNPRQEALVAHDHSLPEPPPYPQDSSPAELFEVNSINYAWNAVALNITASQPSLLVLGDAHYPGWTAYVNGKQQPIYRVNIDFRGIFVDAGNHEIRFVYTPWQWPLGIGIALATFLLCTITLVFRLRIVGKRRSS